MESLTNDAGKTGYPLSKNENGFVKFIPPHLHKLKTKMSISVLKLLNCNRISLWPRFK